MTRQEEEEDRQDPTDLNLYLNSSSSSVLSASEMGVVAAAILILAFAACAAPAEDRDGNSTAVLAPLFPAMFVFGDSLADTGNNNYLLTLARADMAPNGIDFPSGATGRFCNGKTIIDVTCDLVGLPFVPPCLAPTTAGGKLLTGVNYASAAGGILSTSGRNYIENMPLSKQLEHFNTTRAEIYEQLGSHRASKHISKSLFSIVIGSNDYINNYFVNATTHSSYTTKAFRNLLISSLTRDLKTLYRLGARNFLVSGVGPLGCIPSILSRRSPDGACVESINHMIIRYNLALKRRIRSLNAQLHGATFIFVNAFGGMREIINTPHAFGFNATNIGCCGGGRFNGQMPCFPLVTSSLCGNRSSYVFWDAFHPTEAVNVILGQRFFNGSEQYAYPINIQQLASKQNAN